MQVNKDSRSVLVSERDHYVYIQKVKDELYKDQQSGVGYPQMDDTMSRVEQTSMFSKEESIRQRGTGGKGQDNNFKVDLNEMRRGSEMVMRAKLV